MTTWLANQALSVIEDPRASDLDRRDAEKFVSHWSAQWQQEALAHAARRQEGLEQRQARLHEAVRATQLEADENRRAVDAGELSSADFLNRNAILTARRKEFGRHLTGLQTTEAAIDDIRADPAEWYDSLIQKWPTLHQTRPDISTWVLEKRQQRNHQERERLRKLK